jgi:peptide/nickel transport system substrate-binding protein
MIKKIIAILAVFSLLSLGASCSSQEPAVGGTLNWALVGIPGMLNPVLSTDPASARIVEHIYQGLVCYDENLQLVGQLALDWEVSPDNLEWTFYLRRDVTWHDGKPFTARDVEFTMDTIAFNGDYPGNRAAEFERLKGIEVVDDYTIRFMLSEPWGPFLANMRQGILPRHIFDPNLAVGADRVAIADMAKHPRNWQPVGTGPYVFASWVDNQYITLECNPGYYGSGPYIQTLCFRFYPDSAAAIAALEAGEVDLVTDIPPQHAQRLEEKLGESHRFYGTQELGYEVLCFNFRPNAFGRGKDNPWLDRRVRQAVAHALNREQYIQDVLEGKGIIMNSPILPDSWFYPEIASEYAYDPDAAAALLSEAGWRLGADGCRYKDNQRFTFALTLREDNALEMAMAEMIRRDLETVGLEMELNAVSWNRMLVNHMYAGEFHLLLTGLRLSADPDVFDLFHSTAVQEGLNFGAFYNTDLDIALKLGRQAGNPEARREFYAQALDILTRELPYVFLFSRELTVAVADNVKGFGVSPLGPCRVEAWYIEENK